MKKTTELGLYFLGLPFVISASVEFLPQWVAVPIFLIAGLVWLGVFIQITKYEGEKKDETKR